jgi:hypothetical protein
MNDNAGDRRGLRRRSRAHRAGMLEDVSPSRQCRGGLRLAAVMAGLTGIALLAAGCGGGSNTAGSTAGNVSSTGQPMSAYVRCMQNHGLSVYAALHKPGSALPPADVPFVGGWTIVGDGLNSPGYPAAARACQHLLPTGTPPSGAYLHQQLVSALKGAACLRGHGYPDFPDPTDQPGYVYYPPLPDSIDTSSPRFQSAKKACGVFLPQPAPTPVTSTP